MRTALFSSLLFVALAVPGLPALAEDALRTLTVNGEGLVSATPDMATVSLAVRVEAEEASDALDGASLATTGILDMLATQQIAPGDIRTGTIRLNPRYSSSTLSSGNRIIGYTAVNSVEVKVRDLDQLGRLLSDAVSEGANTLGGVSFGLQDPTSFEDEARRLAVADAMRRAALYADAANVTLDGLISLNEAGTGGYRPVMADSMMMEASISRSEVDVPVSAGEIDLQASVVMIFALED